MKKEVLSTLKGPINYFFSELGAELKQFAKSRILEYQAEEYNRNLNVKTVIHRSKPVKLDDVYQPLFLKVSFRQDNREDWSKKIPTNSIKALMKDKQFLTIIGDAGSGKSMLIKHLYLQSIREKFKIPVKIELRDLNDFKGTFKKYVIEEIFKFENLGSNERKIEQLLTSGKFIFFLDGYDEIKSNQIFKISRSINRFIKLHNKNSYVLTSRPYTTIEYFPLFHNFFIWELWEDDIDEFIDRQLPKDERNLADKIIKSIKRKENQSYRSFLSNPLLLSLFIVSFQSYALIPEHKSTFYRQVFDALFSQHDALSKLGFTREKVSGLSKEQFEDVLEVFSFLTYFNEMYHFDIDNIYYLFEEIKKNKEKIQFDDDELLKDLTVALSIITKDGLQYKFPHRSIQEYFAAKYIGKLDNAIKTEVYSKMRSRILNSSSFEIFNFCTILREIDEKGYVPNFLLPALINLKEQLSKNNIEQADEKNIMDLFQLKFWLTFELLWKVVDDIDLLYDNRKKISEKIDSLREEERNKKINKRDYEQEYQRIVNEEVKPFLFELCDFVTKKEKEISSRNRKDNSGDINLVNLI